MEKNEFNTTTKVTDWNTGEETDWPKPGDESTPQVVIVPNEPSKGFLTGMALKAGELITSPLKEDKIESFRKAAAPLVRWLEENCDPHATVIVNDSYAELKTGEMGVPFNENYLQYERIHKQ